MAAGCDFFGATPVTVLRASRAPSPRPTVAGRCSVLPHRCTDPHPNGFMSGLTGWPHALFSGTCHSWKPRPSESSHIFAENYSRSVSDVTSGVRRVGEAVDGECDGDHDSGRHRRTADRVGGVVEVEGDERDRDDAAAGEGGQGE